MFLDQLLKGTRLIQGVPDLDQLAESRNATRQNRLVRIVYGDDEAAIYNDDPGKLKYFKLHGCCREIDEHPGKAPRLVLTRADFRDAGRKNALLVDMLRQYSYSCSIVFLGFRADKPENDYLLGNVLDAYQRISGAFPQAPFRPFAVLPDIDVEMERDLRDAGLNPLKGRFEDFIQSAYEITRQSESSSRKSRHAEDKVIITVDQRPSFEISVGELQQYASQFKACHDTSLVEEADRLKGLTRAQLIDLWKSEPCDGFLAAPNYIRRDQFSGFVSDLQRQIADTVKTGTSHILWVTGRRGSGKSTLARQLLHYAYSELRQPSIQLNPSGHHYAAVRPGEQAVHVSGWDESVIDKFLSLFSPYSQEKGAGNLAPVVLADHAAYQAHALDHFLGYLEDHGKACVLIFPISEEEAATAEWIEGQTEPASRYISRLRSMHPGHIRRLEQRLSDSEIDDLFDVVARLEPQLVPNRELLVNRAKDASYCDRDILLILYTWFDERFRRLDEIIAEQVLLLEHDPMLADLYLATAVFHQYNFRPRLSLTAQAVGLTPEALSTLRGEPLFGALIDVYDGQPSEAEELGATRHPVFSRSILQRVAPDVSKQADYLAKVLECCTRIDLEFVRGFLTYIYEYIALSADLVQKLKVASEKHLGTDYVLNHQYAAYLIRENVKLDDARYYLDLALREHDGDASIIHSLGNLAYRRYREHLLGDIQQAHVDFEDARRFFLRSRAARIDEEEHAYYTEIDMIHYRLQNEQDSEEVRTILNAERHALLFEGLRVVPSERQNLIRGLLGKERAFHQLEETERTSLAKLILAGSAGHVLIDYYGRSLLGRSSGRGWPRLVQVVDVYWPKAQKDLSLAVVVSLLAKYGFVRNAESRFQLLQSFYDSAVRCRETEISFALLSEYVRLLFVDAFVLGRFQFLKTAIPDVIELFRQRKPRFLGDEYILPTALYSFDESRRQDNQRLFEINAGCFERGSVSPAERFQKTVRLLASDANEHFVNIEFDPVTRYFVRAVRREIATKAGPVDVSFAVKYSADGFLATDFRT